MQDYSICILGRSGRLIREIEIICASEETTIELAQQWADGFDVELWQLDRFIARFASSGTTSDNGGLYAEARHSLSQ